MLPPGDAPVTLHAMPPHFPLRMVAVAVLTSLSAIPSHAASPGGARVTQAQKDVSSAGAPLQTGDTPATGVPVVTGANSRAELKLANGTTVRIGQGSSFSFDGGNLSLKQGSALFKLGGGKAKITTPSLGCTAGTGVISTHSAKNYEACFVIEGSAVVNGVSLKTGEGYVRENGSARKIAFDVKRMLDTSFLVTKFPKTPWVVEAFAAAAIQSELLAANRAQSALLSGRTPVNAAAAGKVHAASGSVASAVRNSQGAGTAAIASSSAARVSGGTLVVSSGASVSGGVITTGAGTLSLGTSNTYSGGSGATLNVGGSGATVYVGGMRQFTTGGTGQVINIGTTPVSGGNGLGNAGASTNAGVILVGNPGTVVNAGNIHTNNGVLTVNGANTGVLNVNAGGSLHTITTANGVEVTFGDGLPFTAASPPLKK